ncbi:unnamed protein product [Caenorhabditis auriculariae]|uniref:Uncharacterized protein n=1 Tax=Caenorhabditis auriculariae TaxID=2777116 RepID=A0A8S1H2K2_9PELO|nr:unnamed protein product [Caenorhabditis auriculariae]
MSSHTSQFNDAITKCNNCLFLMRQLKLRMVKMHAMVLSTPREPMYRRRDIAMRVERMSAEIRGYYDKLEAQSKRVPGAVPQTDSVNNLRKLYSEEYTTDYENFSNLIETMVDSGNWNEGQYQVFFYLNEFLRAPKRKHSIFIRKPRIFTNAALAAQAHTYFEYAFRGLKKEIASKQLGIYPKILLNSPQSMAIEIKFGVTGPDKADKTVAYTMKFLLSEINGSSTSPILRDTPFFRKMTAQANYHLQMSFSSIRWSSGTLVTLVQYFGKMRELFDAKCKNCRKVMKDFLPPLCFDIRHPKETALHEFCK